VWEQARGSEQDFIAGSVSFKPAGMRHSNRWGEAGALMFSLRFPHSREDPALEAGWRLPNQAKLMRSLAKLCILAEDEEVRSDLAKDIVAVCAGAAERMMGIPPRWLESVRCEIRDSEGLASISGIAARIGAHRVYLSRAFTLHYGIPPAAYRLRCRAAHAIAAAVARPASLAQSALEAGFCDQSHAARTVKNSTGLTLGEIVASLSTRPGRR
jgi:AraC family transcriptional regulator